MNIESLKSLLTSLNTPDGKLDYRKFAFPAISIVTSLIVIAAVVIPQSMQLIENQNNITDLQTQIDNLSSKVNTLNSISAPQFESDTAIINKALPGNKDYIDSTSSIQDAIDKTKVTLTGISFAEGQPTGGIENYKIKVDLQSSLQSINQFISLINRSPRIMRISRIELTGGQNQAEFTATITISAFYALPQKPALTVTQPVSALTADEQTQILQLEKNFKTTTSSSNSQPTGRSDPFN